jgi:hypothetical protein
MDQNENTPPINPEQNKDVISDYYEGYQHLELQSAETQIRKSRNAIFAIAVVMLLGDIITMAASSAFTTTGLLISIGISAVFVGLALLTKKQPLTAILIALVLFLGLWIFALIVLGPEQIYKGIIVRGIILYFLITGIKHAREAERIRKELKKS